MDLSLRSDRDLSACQMEDFPVSFFDDQSAVFVEALSDAASFPRAEITDRLSNDAAFFRTVVQYFLRGSIQRLGKISPDTAEDPGF